jgi:hypothetical protein
MKRRRFPETLLLIVACLLLSACAGVRQMVRDDQLARLQFEEAEMTRARHSVEEVLKNPQHVSLFVGLPALNKSLAHLDGARFLLHGDVAGPETKKVWLHLQRVRMAARNGVPTALLEGTVVRGWARVRVVGEALIAVELDPDEIGEAHLRVRLRSLRPTILFGPWAIPVWGLIRDVAELGLSQNLPKLDPNLDELPIQLTKVQGIKEKATSKEEISSQNFLNARYRIDTPAIQFNVSQLIQAFVLDDGLYLFVKYQR